MAHQGRCPTKAAFGAVELCRVENDAGQVVSLLAVDGAGPALGASPPPAH